MPIIDLQRRLQECGRIRIGQQVAASGGKTRPARLETFRLTSPDKTRIDNAAHLYGGHVETWQAPSGQQYECVTTTDRLAVIVPPAAMAFSQWFELWSATGCLRRCDSVNEQLTDDACICAQEDAERQCDYHTRLSVMLRDMPGLGLWRLDTQGYYAAVELAGAVDIITLAANRGEMLPAVLRLEQRVIKRANETTKRFAVPVLDIQATPAQLLDATQRVAFRLDNNSADQRSNVTPVPDEQRLRVGSIAQQVATEDEPAQRRARRAQPIAATHVQPRTRAQLRQQQQESQSQPGVGDQRPSGTGQRRDQDPTPRSSESHDLSPRPAETPPPPLVVDPIAQLNRESQMATGDPVDDAPPWEHQRDPGPGQIPLEDTDSDDAHAEQATHVSREDLTELHKLLKQHNLGDAATGLAWLSAAVARTITNTKQLTPSEYDAVIDTLSDNT